MNCHRLAILLLLFTSLTLTAHGSHARGYLYESTFRSVGENYINKLEDFPTDQVEQLPANQQEACRQRYGGILNDALLDIRVSLGYFDWTVGHEVRSGTRNYGLSPSMDLGAYAALSDLLTSRCSGRARFCGFQLESSDNPYIFVRDVVIQGNRVRARLQMHFSSASEFLDNNVGSSQQQARTSFMESFFAQSLQNADATFYFGHSRNGGGPDFSPPVFVRGRNKVDYNGYYEVYQPGFKKMLTALTASGNQTKIIGMMSCDSRDHFLRRLRNTAPHTGIITSTAVVNVDEVYTAMIGAIDSLLRGQCQKSFYKELRMTSRNAENITMDGMFE